MTDEQSTELIPNCPVTSVEWNNNLHSTTQKGEGEVIVTRENGDQSLYVVDLQTGELLDSVAWRGPGGRVADGYFEAERKAIQEFWERSK